MFNHMSVANKLLFSGHDFLLVHGVGNGSISTLKLAMQ